MDKKIEPPIKPNLLGFNFDEEEFIKGELEFKKKLINCQSGKNEKELPFIFKHFYFDAKNQAVGGIENMRINPVKKS